VLFVVGRGWVGECTLQATSKYIALNNEACIELAYIDGFTALLWVLVLFHTICVNEWTVDVHRNSWPLFAIRMH
jgi:hypothetical protein